jgi:hypothetical protein
MSDQLHAPAALPPPAQNSGSHGVVVWFVPRTGLDVLQKRKLLSVGIVQSAVQS